VQNGLSFFASLALFSLAGALILVFGTMITRVAVQLAKVTGLGEAVMGALFLGARTSLPEIATSVTAAIVGHADLAMSNAIGSVAGQTAFLALADMAYRHANLEHAAASAENLMLAALLTAILLMGLVYREKHGIANIGLESFLVLSFYVGAFALLLVVGG
jgi:cation:H+ antiporter